MDINQKLRERRKKLDLEKRHLKAKVLKQYEKETSNQTESNDGNKDKKLKSFNELIDKYTKTEQFSTKTNEVLVNEKPREVKTNSDRRNYNKENKKSNVNDKNRFSKNKEVKGDKDNINNKNNNNITKHKKFETKEKFNDFKRRQYKKLNEKNNRGQPVLKNKIEYLFNKIKNSRK